MEKQQLQRLQKIESRIYEIAKDEGLDLIDIEFDVVPEQKMFEIMSYHLPGQISNWKFGRDFERIRTIYENSKGALPLEVVTTTNPARAYLMANNSFAIQTLVVAHVVAHVAFSTMNKYHCEADKNMISKLSSANKRFNNYEKKYGIDIVEKTVDAGHSIYIHSSPTQKDETEDEKRERIFERIKRKKWDRKDTEFQDMFNDDNRPSQKMERDLYNHKLWMSLKGRTPVEPTEDLLRYIIDNSRVLSDWQKDILEILRSEGQYFHPMIKTKYINEGFATFMHEKIMRQLFNEGLLNSEEHAEYNYTNSLVKARNPFSMNPYLIGCTIWEDIIDRYDKGRFGIEWEEEEDQRVKKDWDTKAMKGKEKMLEVLRTHNDWFFMQNFLTNDIVRDLELYIYVQTSNIFFDEIVVADKTISETKDLIIKSFANSGIPKIAITNGDYGGTGILQLKHEHVLDLDADYTKKTLDHIAFLWGNDVILRTIVNKSQGTYRAKNPYMKKSIE